MLNWGIMMITVVTLKMAPEHCVMGNFCIMWWGGGREILVLLPSVVTLMPSCSLGGKECKPQLVPPLTVWCY